MELYNTMQIRCIAFMICVSCSEMNGSQTVAETSSLPNDTHSKERQSYTRNKGGSATGRWRYRQGKH